MSKPTVFTVLWMVFALMLSMPITAEEVKKSPSTLAEMSVSPTQIDWAPSVEAQRWVLTLSGPDEFLLRRELKAGKALFLSIFDSEGDRLRDGSYTWELKAVSKSPASPRRQAGSFSIQDGSFVETPRGNGGGAPKPPLVLTTAEDSIETGNLIVQQNACIGDECSTTDANFSALKLKSVNPNILFDGIELPEGGGGSPHDWGLFVNHSNAAQFSIVDFNDEFPSSTSLIPFSIAAGAPNDSLFIAGNGNVGLGTSTPVDKLHLLDSADVGTVLRVENSSAGANAQGSFRAQSNTAVVHFRAHSSGRTINRFGVVLGGWSEIVQDIGNGLAIGTQNNASLILGTNNTNRLHITGAGNVGIGTASPGSKLDIVANAAATESARVYNTSATGFSGFSYFDESTSIGLFIGLDNANNNTRINSVNNNPIVIMTNSTERIRFPAPGGNVITAANGATLTAGGVWQDNSSRASKRDIVELSDDAALEALRELTPVTFRYKAEPDEQYAGFIAEDLPDLVATQDHKHMSSMDVVAVLTKVVQDQQKTIEELSARLADLEGKKK